MSDAHDIAAMLLPVILVLALGIVATLVSRAVKLSPIVGFLILGGLAHTVFPHLIRADGYVPLLAELGVVFLLFDIGMHFSVTHVREEAGDILGFGSVQVLAGTVVLGLIGMAFGVPIGHAILLGATLALSSTAVVAGIIRERHQRNCPVGLTATAILVFQDLVGIFILIIVTAMDKGGGALTALGFAVVKTVIAFGFVVLAARLLVKPIFHYLTRHGGEEIFTGVALVIALAAGWAADRAGLSMTLGAFLGGMIVAESPFRAIVQAEINPFRGLLLGFFFISVGASIDLHAVADGWFIIIAMAIGIIVAKAFSNALASLVFRWSVPGSVQLGFLLAQGSEFAFVVLGLPALQSAFGAATASRLIAAVALTLAFTPLLSAGGRKLAGHLRARASRMDYDELKAKNETLPVLIIGMGQVGRTIADALTEFDIGYDSVERDGERLRIALADGYHSFFGDADDPRFWRAADMERRHFSIRTATSPETMEGLFPALETFYPRVRRIAIVKDEITADRMREVGVQALVDRQIPAGLEAARYLLGELNVPAAEIENWAGKQLVDA